MLQHCRRPWGGHITEERSNSVPDPSPRGMGRRVQRGGRGRRLNSIAYRQGTSKREGAQSVNKSVSHEVIQKTPPPTKHPNRVRNA